jgi:ABC-2 type transport system ATP-binding protein
MIEVKNLTFSYTKTSNIFNNLSFTIKDNFYGLIGINGAGKSTLLKLCLGFIQPEAGDIICNGLSSRSQRTEMLKIIGVMHENPKFPSWVRPLDYLKWVGQLRGLSTNESRIKATELLKQFGLLERKHDKVSDLSAGLTQRFALTQAIIGNPQILFLDEPTTNMDIRFRNLVMEYLKNLSIDTNTQIVVMSHILSDLERYCDYTGILHEGQLVYEDSIQNLLKSTSYRFFILRGDDIGVMKKELSKNEIKIVKEGRNEIIVEYPEGIDNLRNIFSNTYSCIISPQRSLLEQRFLDMTGVQETQILENTS